MPLDIPSTLEKWAKTMLKPDSITFSPVLLAAVDFLGVFHTADAAAPSTWRHIQVEWSLTGQLDRADHFVTTFDIAKISGGNIQPDWSPADYTAVDTALHTLVTDWTGHAVASLNPLEARYYIRTFNPPTEVKPYPPSGPPDFVSTFTPGNATGTVWMVPQGASTHTERTPYRKHWGRVYWPTPAPTALSSTGRLSTAVVDAVALEVHNVYDLLMGQGFFPVVPVTQVQMSTSRTLLTVTSVEVDDIPDVIRRRRPKTTQHRSIQPVAP